MMRSLLTLVLLGVAIGVCWGGEGDPVDSGVAKQPIFLMCPHKEDYGSWSLFLNVDKNDPSIVLGLGLEEIPLHNSKVDGYLKVLAMQQDQTGARRPVASLDAKDFGSSILHVIKDDALKVKVTQVGADYQLGISLRISLKGRFELGDCKASNIVLKYDKALKIWEMYATKLDDKDGHDVAAGKLVRLTGFAFPVTFFGIYRLAAVQPGGTPILLLDK